MKKRERLKIQGGWKWLLASVCLELLSCGAFAQDDSETAPATPPPSQSSPSNDGPTAIPGGSYAPATPAPPGDYPPLGGPDTNSPSASQPSGSNENSSEEGSSSGSSSSSTPEYPTESGGQSTSGSPTSSNNPSTSISGGSTIRNNSGTSSSGGTSSTPSTIRGQGTQTQPNAQSNTASYKTYTRTTGAGSNSQTPGTGCDGAPTGGGSSNNYAAEAYRRQQVQQINQQAANSAFLNAEGAESYQMQQQDNYNSFQRQQDISDTQSWGNAINTLNSFDQQRSSPANEGPSISDTISRDQAQVSALDSSAEGYCDTMIRNISSEEQIPMAESRGEWPLAILQNSQQPTPSQQSTTTIILQGSQQPSGPIDEFNPPPPPQKPLIIENSQQIATSSQSTTTPTILQGSQQPSGPIDEFNSPPPPQKPLIIENSQQTASSSQSTPPPIILQGSQQPSGPIDEFNPTPPSPVPSIIQGSQQGESSTQSGNTSTILQNIAPPRASTPVNSTIQNNSGQGMDDMERKILSTDVTGPGSILIADSGFGNPAAVTPLSWNGGNNSSNSQPTSDAERAAQLINSPSREDRTEAEILQMSQPPLLGVNLKPRGYLVPDDLNTDNTSCLIPSPNDKLAYTAIVTTGPLTLQEEDQEEEQVEMSKNVAQDVKDDVGNTGSAGIRLYSAGQNAFWQDYKNTYPKKTITISPLTYGPQFNATGSQTVFSPASNPFPPQTAPAPTGTQKPVPLHLNEAMSPTKKNSISTTPKIDPTALENETKAQNLAKTAQQLVQQKHYDEAATDYTKAWALEPNSAHLGLEAIDAHLKAHEENDALKQLTHLKATQPTLPIDDLITAVSKAVHLREHISDLQASLISRHHGSTSKADEFMVKLQNLH